MGMEEKQELKYECRLCKKRYPSGKSLGGHMRSHVIASSNASSSSSPLHKLKLKNKVKKGLVFENRKSGITVFAGCDYRGYGLRENPRKTWRMVDTNTNQERICTQCGKSFHSLKALCGHMSSHSEKERNFTTFKQDDDDDSWASEEEDEDGDMMGRSAKYRAVAVIGCSSNSYGVESEQEELAMCLMMLSRDSGHRLGFNYRDESSDKNSSNSYANGSVKSVELDNSESGYFENGAKELESDDSVYGCASNYGINKRNTEHEYRRDRVQCSVKKVKMADLSPTPRSSNKEGKYKCSVCLKFFKTHQALGGHILTHMREEIKNASYIGEHEKRKGHYCPFCPKVFRSGQALGGHKRSHLIGSSSQDKASPKNQNRLLDLNLPAPLEEDSN